MDKEDLTILISKAIQVQVYDVVEGTDPTIHAHVRRSDDRDSKNGEITSVVSRGVERIRKCFLPQFDV